MTKLFASITKEVLIVLNDKVGLLIMYAMPILLVFIITVTQDSVFRLINENQVELLVINQDDEQYSDSLINILKHSGSFVVDLYKDIPDDDIYHFMSSKNSLFALHIPQGYSASVEANAARISGLMLTEFGLDVPDESHVTEVQEEVTIDLYFDPVLQDNFKLSLATGLNTIVRGMESSVMIYRLYHDMGFEEVPDELKAQFESGQDRIRLLTVADQRAMATPNSSQHNVPAWSVFAMFFMVVSLGGNIVKERLSGSFVRLMTIPQSFEYTIISKLIVYLFIALTQLTILFSIGIFLFPLIGLPELLLPGNILALLVLSLLSALAAISYALLIGSYAKTQEQANGFGAISIIILAAIGGIWVPSFVMPDFLQTIAKISPLYWCLEGYYSLFLKGGYWVELKSSILYLLFFIFGCFTLTFIKFRSLNYIKI